MPDACKLFTLVLNLRQANGDDRLSMLVQSKTKTKRKNVRDLGKFQHRSHETIAGDGRSASQHRLDIFVESQEAQAQKC